MSTKPAFAILGCVACLSAGLVMLAVTTGKPDLGSPTISEPRTPIPSHPEVLVAPPRVTEGHDESPTPSPLEDRATPQAAVLTATDPRATDPHRPTPDAEDLRRENFQRELSRSIEDFERELEQPFPDDEIGNEMKRIRALGKRDDEESTRLLLALARESPDPSFRAEAVASLGRRFPIEPVVVEALIERVGSDPSPGVRDVAIDWLANRVSRKNPAYPAVLDAVLSAFDRDDDFGVILSSMAALSRFLDHQDFLSRLQDRRRREPNPERAAILDSFFQRFASPSGQ